MNGLTIEFKPIIAVINASPTLFDLDTVSTQLIDYKARQEAFLQQSAIHVNCSTYVPWNLSDNSSMVFQAHSSSIGGQGSGGPLGSGPLRAPTLFVL